MMNSIPVDQLQNKTNTGLQVITFKADDEPHQNQNHGVHRDDHYIFFILKKGSGKLKVDFQDIAVTAGHIYLRFHGPAKLYASKYTTATLKKYAGKAAAWVHEGYQVWAFFNNDYYGYALENARTFRELVNV